MSDERTFLFVQYNRTEPIEIDGNDCRNVAQLIEKVKQKLELGVKLNELTLHKFSGEKLEADFKIGQLVEEIDFINNARILLLLRRRGDSGIFSRRQLISEKSQKSRGNSYSFSTFWNLFSGFASLSSTSSPSKPFRMSQGQLSSPCSQLGEPSSLISPGAASPLLEFSSNSAVEGVLRKRRVGESS